MATKKNAATVLNDNAKSILDGIDLHEFNRTKAIITQKASAALAERIQAIRGIISEMQSIVDLSGVGVNIQDLIYEIGEAKQTLDPDTDWNSSSAYC